LIRGAALVRRASGLPHGAETPFMNALRTITVAFGLVATACGGATSNSATCEEYAAELAARARGGATPEEVVEFVEETSEHVAHLIARNADDARVCADAVIEAVLSSGLADFSEQFQD